MPPPHPPAEPRNHIYRLTLCQQKEILISGEKVWTESGTRYTPHLLSTCTQIRSEASSIYYLENTFAIWAIGFVPTAVLAFEATARHYVTVAKIEYRVNTRMSLTGTKYSWVGLMRWLKAFYDGEAEAFVDKAPIKVLSEADDFAVAAFEVVERLRQQGVEWREVVKAVEGLKKEVKEESKGSKRAVKWRKMGM